jgi:hypothetical protein
MKSSCLGEDRINEEIDRLREDYSDFEVREESHRVDEQIFNAKLEDVKSGRMGDTRTMIIDDQGRTLLVRLKGNPDYWGQSRRGT